MMFVVDGKQHLEFVPTHDIKASMERGGHPVSLADILAALGEATEKINQLQAENDRLWKIAMKDPSTVVVQQQTPAKVGPTQAQIAAQQKAEAYARRQQTLQMWLMLQGANHSQPYQLPTPVNPNANRLQTTCTTYRLGDMTHTNCN
jgi:ABC-type nitrate/sulfonate/bicarbonate transport system substrate-binding protein